MPFENRFATPDRPATPAVCSRGSDRRPHHLFQRVIPGRLACVGPVVVTDSEVPPTLTANGLELGQLTDRLRLVSVASWQV